MGFELLKRFHAVVFESLLVLDLSTALDCASQSIAQSASQPGVRFTFLTRLTLYVVLAERTAMTLATYHPPFLVHAYTRAAAFDAHIPVFPVLAEYTALAILALFPHSLVLAYTRAAAFDAHILSFPVLTVRGQRNMYLLTRPAL